MKTEFFPPGNPHLAGESTTHPIEPRYGTLAALLALQAAASQSSAPSSRPSLRGRLGAAGLSLAGISPQRRRALPAHRIAAHSGASNCRI